MTVPMTIGGKPVGTVIAEPVTNPATGEVFAHGPACSADQLDLAVDAARKAFPDWAARSLDERRSHLRSCGDILAAHRHEVAELLTREQGKPLAQALAEVDLSASWFGQTAELDPGEEVLGEGITMRRVPHGVVAAVTPFNFPVILSVCKFAPALLAGNTVVVKPSPVTPLSTLHMVSLFADALPPGVLNAVSGDPGLGPAVSDHDSVDLVSFTGSVPVGRAIARSAATRLRRVVLELGGNDPAIVLPGAALDDIAPALFALSMINSGQFCAAIKRIYVHEQDRARLAGLLAELAGEVRMGDGMDPASTHGPLTNASQVDRAARLVSASGGKALAGGTPTGGAGNFFPATVVTDLPVGTGLETGEQFAPVIPVLGYRDVTAAVTAANATEFGLGASLWGDTEQAVTLAPRIEAGTVWVNTHGDLRHDVAFGGMKSSGIGVEYGYWGLLEYTRIQVTNVRS
ncbi:aldehyde dehydrogenase family protein [Actinocrispum sp. NPDC049592]|uniref:aldehyde dehydrogenase family protein n=1 Tax=Actinocrispum sp. NPDC049592 TaxID=3154835 RepID=UPI0034177A31